MFNTLTDAISWVNNCKKFSKRFDLSDMEDALKLLKNPDKDFKVIHIGGTNGKGSTSVTLKNVLKLHGLKVGLYVSPFVVKFNERIQINDDYISDDRLLELINKMYYFNLEFEKSHQPLSFFEIITLISFIYFSEEKVDIAIYEVGLGGRLDATNIVKPLVSAVTNIQKDHTAQLGLTYKKILKEKLGIMKYRTPFVTAIDREELMETIKEYSFAYEAPLYLVRNLKNIRIKENGTLFTYKGKKYKTSLIGFHQARNMSVVIEIINVLNTVYGFNISDETINNALKNTFWPGRFEVINKDIILDGGHNTEGIEALKKTILAYTAKDITVVFTAMADKDISNMVKTLDSFAKRIIFTEIPYSRCEKALNLINLSHLSDKMAIEKYDIAIKKALSYIDSRNAVLICGSLYFISYARDLLLGGKIKC